MCAGGLGCLIKYNPGQESEHNKTGTCVTEQGAQCKDVKSGVSCRPGQIGVPSEFVFCPASQPHGGCDNTNSGGNSQQSNRVAVTDQQQGGFLFSGSSSVTSPSPSVSDDSSDKGSRRTIIGDTIHSIVTGAGVNVPNVPKAVHQLINGK